MLAKFFANLKKLESSAKKGKSTEKISLSDWSVSKCGGTISISD